MAMGTVEINKYFRKTETVFVSSRVSSDNSTKRP